MIGAKKETGLLTLMALAISLVLCSFSVNANIININSLTNTPENPITFYLSAGTYDVTPIGTADGGLYDAWNASRTRPRWVNAYSISSDEFAAFRTWDSTEYLTPLLALENATSTNFTLSTAGNVNFFNGDSFHPDNFGGISLKVTPAVASVPELNSKPLPIVFFLVVFILLSWLERKKRAATWVG